METNRICGQLNKSFSTNNLLNNQNKTKTFSSFGQVIINVPHTVMCLSLQCDKEAGGWFENMQCLQRAVVLSFSACVWKWKAGGWSQSCRNATQQKKQSYLGVAGSLPCFLSVHVLYLPHPSLHLLSTISPSSLLCSPNSPNRNRSNKTSQPKLVLFVLVVLVGVLRSHQLQPTKDIVKTYPTVSELNEWSPW